MEGSLLLLILCFALYFLPVIGAGLRKVKAWGGIFALNLFLGWTVIGWLAALIWAASGETEAEANAKVIDYAKLAAAMKSQEAPQTGPSTVAGYRYRTETSPQIAWHEIDPPNVRRDSAMVRIGRRLGNLANRRRH